MYNPAVQSIDVLTAHSSAVTVSRQLVCSSRTCGVTLAVVGVLAATAGMVSSDSSIVWFLRVFGAAALVAVLPGVFTTLAWCPRSSFNLFELIGTGLGISAALVQLLTIMAVMYAWGIDISLTLLAGWTILHAAVALRRRNIVTTLSASLGDMLLLVILLPLGIVLYFVGSPFDSTEPRIHVSIVQRLVHLSSPTLYSIYVAPEIAYTYPFPGIHYMLALMGRAEGIDAFFLYHKLRGFWGIASPILLYGCARTIFNSSRIALSTTFIAVGLVVNGGFGAVPDFSWAQMAPVSHASDVAMGVLLPALLLLSLQFLKASDRRERRFLLTAALALATMLVMVHPREAVQFVVYFGTFAALAMLVANVRHFSARAALLALATLTILIVYANWQQSIVQASTELVEREREGLAQTLRAASWRELLSPPIPLLQGHLIAFWTFFSGWNPVVLLASPVVLFTLRKEPLTLLLAASIVTYLAIVRFPIFGIPYLYLTYFEMLYTPVRNVIFFIHMLAGVGIFLVAAWLARFHYVVLIAGALAAAGLTTIIFRGFAAYLARDLDVPDLLFAPVLAAYAGWLWWAARAGRREPPTSDWIDSPRPRWMLAMATLCVPLLVVTEFDESSLRRLPPISTTATPDAFLSSLPCLRGGQFCPPPRALVALALEQIPANSVFAVDIDEEYQPSLFMPQQMTAWPGRAEGLIPRTVFDKYYEHYDRVKIAYEAQPFFNDRETRAERLSFIRDMHVTHVLLNPRVYTLMSEVLTRDPDVFTRMYDDGSWALYEVTPQYGSTRL
jgi:hypothetical protein